jgi:hypothetical protein
LLLLLLLLLLQAATAASNVISRSIRSFTNMKRTAAAR